MKFRGEAAGLAAAVIVCLAASEIHQAWAQNRPARNGWVLHDSRSAGKAYFGIDRSREGDRWTMTTDVDWSSFRGLSRSQLAGLEGRHQFELARDAGTVRCTGSFAGGRGVGTYEFEPSSAFATELAKLGFLSPSRDDLFMMALNDFSLDFARAVKRAGLSATVGDLMELRTHGVNTGFIRSVKAAGYDLAARDLVELRMHGVSPEFLASVRQAGYGDLSVREVIGLRDQGIDDRFLSAMARQGVKPAANELTALFHHGVTPEFLGAARSMGYRFTVQQAIELRNHGVDVAYLRKLKDTGFDRLPPEKIIQLRIHGVD